MKCSKCGTENREGARFCRACGQTLEAPVAPPILPETDAEGGLAAERAPTLDEVELPTGVAAAEPTPEQEPPLEPIPEAEKEAGAEPERASGG